MSVKQNNGQFDCCAEKEPDWKVREFERFSLPALDQYWCQQDNLVLFFSMVLNFQLMGLRTANLVHRFARFPVSGQAKQCLAVDE